MLKVSARDRPSAAALLKSDLLAPKLHLDEGASSGVSFVSAENNRQQLLQTIMVPQNLRQLNRVLPKPCYPSDKSTAESADAAPPAAPPAPPVPPPAEKRAKEPRVDKENKNNCGHQPSSKQHANPSRPTAPSKPTSNIPGVPYSARPGRQHNHAPSSRYGQHAQGAPESNNNPYGVPVHHAAHQHHNYGQHPNYGHQHHGKAGVQSRVQSHRIW